MTTLCRLLLTVSCSSAMRRDDASRAVLWSPDGRVRTWRMTARLETLVPPCDGVAATARPLVTRTLHRLMLPSQIAREVKARWLLRRALKTASESPQTTSECCCRHGTVARLRSGRLADTCAGGFSAAHCFEASAKIASDTAQLTWGAA